MMAALKGATLLLSIFNLLLAGYLALKLAGLPV